MKPDMRVSQDHNDSPNGKNLFDDSGEPTPLREAASTEKDLEQGQQSQPQEIEEQVRQVTGFKVSETSTVTKLVERVN